MLLSITAVCWNVHLHCKAVAKPAQHLRWVETNATGGLGQKNGTGAVAGHINAILSAYLCSLQASGAEAGHDCGQIHQVSPQTHLVTTMRTDPTRPNRIGWTATFAPEASTSKFGKTGKPSSSLSMLNKFRVCAYFDGRHADCVKPRQPPCQDCAWMLRPRHVPLH